MLKIGNIVKVGNNAPFFQGKRGIILSIDTLAGLNFYDVQIDTGKVTCLMECFLKLIEPENKWNPLNYKSHFKPVKLP